MELNIISAWLVTVFLHLGLLVGLAWCLTRRLAPGPWRERLWRLALLGPIVTGSVQSTLGNGPLVWQLSPSAAEAVVDSPLQFQAEQPEASEQALGNHVQGMLPATGVPVPQVTESLPLAGALVGVWLMTALALLLRSYLQRRRALTRLDRSPLHARPDIFDRLASLQRASGGTHRLRLTSSEFLGSPIALSNDEICLPVRALMEFKLEELEAMLAHELAHLQRHDPFWLRVYAALEAIFCFQPLVRLATNALRVEAELACDAWAVKRGASPIGLARCLAQVAQWRPLTPVGLSAMAGRKSDLVQRVERLTLPQAPRDSGPSAALCTATLAFALGAFACLGPGANTGKRANEPNVEGQLNLQLTINGKLRANGTLFSPPQQWGLFEQWLKDHAELEDPADPHSVSKVRASILVDDGVQFPRVLKVVERLANARIWDIEYALGDGARFPIAIPKDLNEIEVQTPEGEESIEEIDGEMLDRLHGLGYVEVEEDPTAHRIEIKLRVATGSPRHVEYEVNDVQNLTLTDLAERIKNSSDDLGESRFVIQASQGIVYGDVIALLDTLFGLGVSGSQFLFVGAD